MEQTSFLFEFGSISGALTATLTRPAFSTHRPKPRKNPRGDFQTELFEALGLPTTSAAAAMETLMARIARRERKAHERHIVRRDQSEWIICRDGSAVSIAMGLDGNDDVLLSTDCGNVHAAIGFVAYAKRRIQAGEGFDLLAGYSDPRPNGTGGNRYAFHGTPIRSEAEAQALIDGIGATSLAAMRQSIVQRYKHCIEPEEIENMIEFAMHNAALTFDPEKTKSKTKDGKARPFRAYAAMCARNRCRKLIAFLTIYSSRLPMTSLDAEICESADGETTSLYSLVASDEPDPAEVCAQNEFRAMRGFANRAEGDFVLILKILSGAWLVPACEKVGEKIRGWAGQFFGILAK